MVGEVVLFPSKMQKAGEQTCRNIAKSDIEAAWMRKERTPA